MKQNQENAALALPYSKSDEANIDGMPGVEPSKNNVEPVSCRDKEMEDHNDLNITLSELKGSTTRR